MMLTKKANVVCLIVVIFAIGIVNGYHPSSDLFQRALNKVLEHHLKKRFPMNSTSTIPTTTLLEVNHS